MKKMGFFYLMSEVFKNQIKTHFSFPINFYLKILQIYYKEKKYSNKLMVQVG